MKILSAIACDDIRQEQNNKHILIGVYGPSVRLSVIPGTIGLAYFLQISTEKNRGETAFRIKVSVRTPDGREKDVVDENATIEKGNARIVIIATPTFPISIEEECDIRFRIKEKDKRWLTVITHHVTLDPNLTSLTTLQPPFEQSPDVTQE